MIFLMSHTYFPPPFCKRLRIRIVNRATYFFNYFDDLFVDWKYSINFAFVNSTLQYLSYTPLSIIINE